MKRDRPSHPIRRLSPYAPALIVLAAGLALSARAWWPDPGRDWPALILGLALTLGLSAYLLHTLARSNRAVGRAGRRTRELAESNARLLEEVAARRAAEDHLTRQNRELTDTLDRLRQTQEQLVQAEKLASLGALVAGVAHEINTPVGVGVTAASTLQARVGEIRAALADNRLKKSTLTEFLETADQSTAILLANLERAAELINSFKQVAVDRSSGQRRRFAVREYLEEVLLSLHPRLKCTPHRVELDCDPQLTLVSDPGAWSQILTNLVLNSLVHAYPDGRAGTLTLRVWPVAGGVELIYGDDGRGMEPEERERVFDPFFTTRRGAGGSGLGMHIVYNLVTRSLGGTIRVTSRPGQGTVFTLTLPVTITEAGDPDAR